MITFLVDGTSYALIRLVDMDIDSQHPLCDIRKILENVGPFKSQYRFPLPVLMSNLGQIPSPPTGVPVNILLSEEELVQVFFDGQGDYRVERPQENIEDTLFPLDTYWVFEYTVPD